jgi:hypothetical protein
MHRSTIVIVAALMLTATLSATAFALSLPAVSAPQAHDLPVIVSAHPVTAGFAVAATRPLDAVPASPATQGTSSGPDAVRVTTPADAGSPSGAASSSGHGDPRDTTSGSSSDSADSPSGSGGSHASDGHDQAGDQHSGDEHEVVSPHLHEADESEHQRDDH